MSTIYDIWNIEAEVENAIEAVLNDNGNAGVNVFTTQDAQPFQKPRGRAEVLCRKGESTGHLAVSDLTGLEYEVEDAWDLEINVAAITQDDIAVHGQYRAYVRFMLARIPTLINTGAAPGLVYHFLTFPIISGGDSILFKPEKGKYQTHMVFNCKVSIHETAWAQFQKPQT